MDQSIMIAHDEIQRLRDALAHIARYHAELSNGDEWELDCAVETIQDCVTTARRALRWE